MRRSWMMILLGAVLAPMAFAQGWATAYEKGLAEARSGNWEEARKAFKQAVAYRTDDVSGPTNLPGPVTERRQWRNGAPYSPNFLAAYCAYRSAGGSTGAAKTEMYRSAASELEALHAKQQYSPESFYLLNWIYVNLNDTEKRLKVDERFAEVRDKASFRVDTEPVAPEEVAAVATMMGRTSESPIPGAPPIVNPTIPQPGIATPITAPGPGMRVAVIPNKFALLIGNSAGKIGGQEVPFAGDDAQRVREALTMSAGYAQENVDLVLNATAAQILASAKALADRIPEGATVFLYFSGTGANLDGKDFFAGVDTESVMDSSTMVAKNEIYKLFMAKGAKVYGFFQAHRPMTNGRYFGMEVPLFGLIGQCQATMPGSSVYSFVRNGKTVGIYTDALVQTLNEFRSNQVPIMEFGWQVFYKMRRGDTGRVGVSSSQTPTLPVLTNLATDAKF
jgi:tetratricopeptide (TPR) repeat protein